MCVNVTNDDGKNTTECLFKQEHSYYFDGNDNGSLDTSDPLDCIRFCLTSHKQFSYIRMSAVRCSCVNKTGKEYVYRSKRYDDVTYIREGEMDDIYMYDWALFAIFFRVLQHILFSFKNLFFIQYKIKCTSWFSEKKGNRKCSWVITVTRIRRSLQHVYHKTSDFFQNCACSRSDAEEGTPPRQLLSEPDQCPGVLIGLGRPSDPFFK